MATIVMIGLLLLWAEMLMFAIIRWLHSRPDKKRGRTSDS